MAPRTPVLIDCFAGAGGLSAGLGEAGFDVRAAFDNDPLAVETYKRNVGVHIIQSDAKSIAANDLLGLAKCKSGQCSLVAGGPPCQGFSRQRRGSDSDSRNDLMFEFLRIVDGVAPEYFLMENVRTILGRRGRLHIDSFLEQAKELGYRMHIKVLDAADFGVAQHRKRAIIVGERDDRPAEFAFPEATHGEGTWHTVRDAIGDLPSPMSAPEEAKAYANHQRDNMSPANRERISYVPQGGGREDIPVHLRLRCHRVSVEKAGHRAVYGRLDWSKPAATITTKCNSFTRGRFAHPSEDRNISMREAARLQGFPDSFAFVGDKVAVAHQIGNAVPPPLGMAIGRALIMALAHRRNKRQSDQSML